MKYLLIGDIHGCFPEFLELLEVAKVDLNNTKVISVGDLTDRGPDAPNVLRWFMEGKAKEYADVCLGNHDHKLMRYLKGNPVKIAHGLGQTIDQLSPVFAVEPHFKKQVLEFLQQLPLVVVTRHFIATHAAYKDPFTVSSKYAEKLALYGDVDGSKDEKGFPVRDGKWREEYKGTKDIIHGHIVVDPAPDIYQAENAQIIDIDGGCCFGGDLVGISYPEKEIFRVKAKQVYCEK